jgi:hypothetical protein
LCSKETTVWVLDTQSVIPFRLTEDEKVPPPVITLPAN